MYTVTAKLKLAVYNFHCFFYIAVCQINFFIQHRMTSACVYAGAGNWLVYNLLHLHTTHSVSLQPGGLAGVTRVSVHQDDFLIPPVAQQQYPRELPSPSPPSPPASLTLTLFPTHSLTPPQLPHAPRHRHRCGRGPRHSRLPHPGRTSSMTRSKPSSTTSSLSR